jgi:hypothetical protein
LITPSLGCFHTIKAITRQPNNYLRNYHLSSYRLQPTSGISHSALTKLGTWALPWFLPLQRHNHCGATNEISLSPLPAPRFSQPSSRSNALVDLQVYSTPQALLGLRSSKLHTDTISTRHPRQIAPSPLPHPSWLPSTNRPVFPRTSAVEDYPFLRLSQFMAPRSLARTGFHLGL